MSLSKSKRKLITTTFSIHLKRTRMTNVVVTEAVVDFNWKMLGANMLRIGKLMKTKMIGIQDLWESRIARINRFKAKGIESLENKD